MRANHVTPAIVLRSRPFGESDKIVSFLTENYGKLTGIAKGAPAYLVEITDGLTGEREENPAAFQHLKEGLVYLEENGTSLHFLTFFELKLLRLAGYQPVLGSCKRCHKEKGQLNDVVASHWNFSPVDGGILCDPCSRSRKELLPLSATAVEVLTALQADSVTLPCRFSLPSSVIKELRSVMLRFIQYHVDREIKSAGFLSQFSSV